MDFGEDVVDAIVANANIRAVDNCTGASSFISKAMYGQSQSDTGDNKITKVADIKAALVWSGMDNDISLWRFQVTDPVHYFVVIPWIKRGNGNTPAFTVLMAYEQHYSIGDYIAGLNGAPTQNGFSYQKERTAAELTTMLTSLLDTVAARQNYFGVAGNKKAAEICYWKYSTISAKSAIKKVNAH